MFDSRGRLLVIRRGQAPARGLWSLPGGRCRDGEDASTACVREVAEETGLHVRVLRHAGRVARDAPDGSVYDIDDFVCTLSGDGTAASPAPEPVAGDDAADARWVDLDDFSALPLAPLLFETLAGWGCLPR